MRISSKYSIAIDFVPTLKLNSHTFPAITLRRTDLGLEGPKLEHVELLSVRPSVRRRPAFLLRYVLRARDLLVRSSAARGREQSQGTEVGMPPETQFSFWSKNQLSARMKIMYKIHGIQVHVCLYEAKLNSERLK